MRTRKRLSGLAPYKPTYVRRRKLSTVLRRGVRIERRTGLPAARSLARRARLIVQIIPWFPRTVTFYLHDRPLQQCDKTQ